VSGSPIIQDGKLVGAVTHVLVNDPTRGYGIFIYDTIMSEVKDGDIILCHDLHGTTVDAMERVIPDLIAKGYQLVTVSELLSNSGKESSAGSAYNKGASH